MAKRKIFAELMEGVAAMGAQRQGKLTLRNYKVKAARLPSVNAKTIRDTRKRLNVSRPVFARKLHINERTLEKMGAGTRQTEFPGSHAVAAGAPVSGHVGSVG